MNIIKKCLPLLVILALASAVRIYHIDEPWLGGNHAFLGAHYSVMARNYVRFGYLETSFAPIVNLGPTLPEQFQYSLVHPPLLPLAISFSFRIFGIHEWSATLVPVLFSLSTLLLLYLMSRRLWGENVALLAAFFLALIPIDAYYARVVITDVPALFFALLTLFFYLLWLEQQKELHYFAIFISYFLGLSSDWPAYYIGPLIVAHYLLFEYKRIRNKSLALLLPLEATLTLILQLAYIAHLSGSIEWFIENALWRANPGGEWSFTATEWLTKLFLRIQLLFTPILPVFALAWGVSFVRDIKRSWLAQQSTSQQSLVLLLLIYGFSHALIFRQDSWIHEFLIFYLGPFFSISAALGAQFIGNRLLRSYHRRIWGTILVVVLFALMAFPLLERAHRGGEGDPKLIEAMHTLKNQLNPGDKLMASSRLGWALEFYLDRPYEVATSLEEFRCLNRQQAPFKSYLFLKEGQVLRTMHGMPTPSVGRDLKEYLLEHYPVQVLSDVFVIFDLTKDMTQDVPPEVERILEPCCDACKSLRFLTTASEWGYNRGQ